MGTITSGTGLISGLNIQDIVTKLMAIERQPVTTLQTRVQDTETQRTAYADLSARVLALKATIDPLQSGTLFQANKATSSDTNTLQVSATAKAAAGTYRVRVQQIATAQQLVSNGVADADRSPLGSGTIVVAAAQAKLSQPTSLDFLNNQHGISKGTIRITDGSGATAQIDLSAAKTVQDVLAAINNATGIHVQAEVKGDRLAITDLTNQQTSPLIIADVAGGKTAQDLGIAGTSVSGQTTITGTDVNTIGENTLLSLLNDGRGIGVNGIGSDLEITASDGKVFTVQLADTMNGNTDLAMLNGGKGVRLGTVRITHANGQISDVDLSSAKTVDDVLKTLQTANVAVAANGARLLITDSLKGDGSLKIEDVTGHAAADLGISGSSSGGDAKTPQTINGQDVYQVRTLGDVLRAINFANGNDGAVTASVSADGKGITLTDHANGSGPLLVGALTGSTAAADLGLLQPSAGGVVTGQRLIASMNSTLLRSLNGGLGIRLGRIQVTDRAGNQSIYDLSGAQSLDDVLTALRSQSGGAQVKVQLNDSGLGLVVNDTSNGTGTLKIEDLDGGMAAEDLKIAGQTTDATLRGGALYRQYISGNTRLSDMNGGKGVAAGSILITDSAGHKTSVAIAAGTGTRLQDVLNKLNNAGGGLKIEARINDTGDGIVIVDTAGGAGQLKIEDNGSTAAADLRIAGTASEDQNSIDGRASVEMTLGASDSLNDLADSLNKMGNLVQASVVNDGTGVAPYRLVVSAANTGTRGALAIDTGGSSLDFSTLVQAQDAIVYFGGNGTTDGIPITSSDNQLDNVIAGTTLTLTGQSEQAVTVTISKDTDTLAKQLSSIVDKYNDVMSHIQTLTSYNADTGQQGVLLGDSTVEQVRNSLYDMMNAIGTNGNLNRSLTDLGFSVGQGSQLSFNQDAFLGAFNSDSNGISQLFTTAKTGLYAHLSDIFSRLTDQAKGVLPQQDQTLKDREDLFNQRITDMNTLLDAKQQQLYNQFYAMETALSQLQGQQSALSSLTALATSTSSSTTTTKK